LGVAYAVRSDFDQTNTKVSIANYRTPDEHYRYQRKLDGGGFAGLGIGGKVWLEASLPKRAGDDNIEGLTIPDAVAALREMVREAESFCEVDRDRCADPMTDAKVVRLDLVRDFDDVEHQGDVLDGLARVPRGPTMKVRRWADGERNLAESLRVGPRAWGATLYDKWAETDGRAPEGRVRFEARLHADQLSSVWAREHGGHVRVVADVAEEKLRSLTRSAFVRCAFDREVATLTNIQQLILARADLKLNSRCMLLAYVTVPGVSSRMHRNQERRYRRLAADIGLTPAAGDVDTSAPGIVRLDFDEGREVLRAA
jgi:hypothetical protein